MGMCATCQCSEDVSYSSVAGVLGLRDVLAPCVQSLVPTAATASASSTNADAEGEGGGESDAQGMVMVNLLVLLCGGAEQVAALEQSGASDMLEVQLQVTLSDLSRLVSCLCADPCNPMGGILDLSFLRMCDVLVCRTSAKKRKCTRSSRCAIALVLSRSKSNVSSSRISHPTNTLPSPPLLLSCCQQHHK